MSANLIIKELIKAGFTHTSDGLLMDFCCREQWTSALISCKESLAKREKQIQTLKDLQNTLEQLCIAKKL